MGICQGGHLSPVGEGLGPWDLHVMSDHDLLAHLPFRSDDDFTLLHEILLIVKAGREEKEGFLGKRETLPPLMDAALAQDDALAACGQCVANHLPFLECLRHAGESTRMAPGRSSRE